MYWASTGRFQSKAGPNPRMVREEDLFRHLEEWIMRTPTYLDTATKLLDAVEARLLAPDPSDPIGPKEWLWLGRALRAIRCQQPQDSEVVCQLGNRLIDLVDRVQEDGCWAYLQLEDTFLNAVKAAASDTGMSLARCLKRDDAMSLEVIAYDFCEVVRDWDPDSWETLNQISEDAQRELLARSDARIDLRPETDEGRLYRLVPSPALRAFDGATASLDANDPCGDGWLACLALWNEGNHWWVEYVRADLADVLARSATSLSEASKALGLMAEPPVEAHALWSDFVRRLIDATPRGVETGVSAALIDDDLVES